jgi:hypothetical protein
MKTHILSDSGPRLTPTGRRVLLAVSIIGAALLLAWALSERIPLRLAGILVLAGTSIALLCWQQWREWTGKV